MTDKVQKIREEVERLREKVMGIRTDFADGQKSILTELLVFIDSLQEIPVSEDLQLEIYNNNPKIIVGTKICLKTNPDVILSIISNDCHGDKFECSNGSVLSLKQIEKYYDIYIEEK